MEWIDVKLQSELADAARMLARERDITVSQLLRDLVSREVSLTRKSTSVQTAQDRLVESLKDRLLPDFLHAKTWPDLKARLAIQGYSVVAAGGGLALHARDTGRRVCTASELGFSHSALVRKMKAPFPDAPRTQSTSRLSSPAVLRAINARPLPEGAHASLCRSANASMTGHVIPPVKDISDDYDVIEPF